MKKILVILSPLIVYYLLYSFVLGHFLGIGDDTFAKIMFIFLGMIPGIFSVYLYQEIDTIDWLKTKTHEEKKQGIRKYIGELREELSLYSEANELLKKVKEYQQGKNS